MTYESLAQITKTLLRQLVTVNNLTVDYTKINEKFKATYEAKFPLILAEVQKESNEADFFGEIKTSGKIRPLVWEVAKVTLTHGCLEYAHELLEIPFPSKS